jgi:hypothetical protein
VEYNKFFFISYFHVIKLVLRDVLNIKKNQKEKEGKGNKEHGLLHLCPSRTRRRVRRNNF